MDGRTREIAWALSAGETEQKTRGRNELGKSSDKNEDWIEDEDWADRAFKERVLNLSEVIGGDCNRRIERG